MDLSRLDDSISFVTLVEEAGQIGNLCPDAKTNGILARAGLALLAIC